MPRLLSIAAVLWLICATAPSFAQDTTTQPNVPPRYTFQPAQDGFLRLDTQSGAIAFCGPRAVGWACQAVPEDRAALEREISRLNDEVTSLKKELAAIKSPGKDDEVKLKLPTREEIEQARAFVEDAWRRLVDMLMTMQKDIMRKS